MAFALKTLAVVLAGLYATTAAQQDAPCSQPHHKLDFLSGKPCPKPSAFEVEMYENNGTLVIETAGPNGDLVVDGTRVVSALRALEAEAAKMRLDHARQIKETTAKVR